MHHHDGPILPHKPDGKPQKDAKEKHIDIVWHHVETGHPIANQLDHSCDPFDDINRLYFLHYMSF